MGSKVVERYFSESPVSWCHALEQMKMLDSGVEEKVLDCVSWVALIVQPCHFFHELKFLRTLEV